MDVLASFGSRTEEAEEILRYNENTFSRIPANQLPHLPLTSESHLPTWEEYAREAERSGAFNVLKERLVQLRFPIQAGISEGEAYRAATRRGRNPDPKQASGLKLFHPEKIQLYIHPSIAGRIPIIIAEVREDFVSLVRALTLRNEPELVPKSMGACIVAGFNNWDRIRQYKAKWIAQNPFQNTESSWPEEFRRLIHQKSLYQDIFIILSKGPYSNVNAQELGLSESEWRRLSLTIRREHECTHYFTRRVFQSMRNNLLDELIADYAGVVAALGYFRSDWVLHFMGLERFPEYRDGGRLENYRGNPPLSDSAFRVLQKLVKATAENLQCFFDEHANNLRTWQANACMLMALTYMTLEELSSLEMSTRLKRLLCDLMAVLGHKEDSTQRGPQTVWRFANSAK